MWKPFARDTEPPTAAAPHPEAGPASLGCAATPAPRIGAIAEVELIGSVAVATLTVTELAQEEGAEQLADLLLQLAETGATNFVLDVQNVRFMDTTCVGCLVEALNRLSASGGQIALASPNHSVHYVFRLTRLDRVFRMCPDVMAALDAVEGRPKD